MTNNNNEQMKIISHYSMGFQNRCLWLSNSNLEFVKNEAGKKSSDKSASRSRLLHTFVFSSFLY